ncbi:MAG: HAMP domain-containing histidine kinase [Bacilli bacterium]|nr:HAMP domain-containing histidine kinase [Bacilli bacterium]
MKWAEFFREYAVLIFLYISLVFCNFLFLILLKVDAGYLIFYFGLFGSFLLFLGFYIFWKKKRFYDSFFHILQQLEEKYFISEMGIQANFLDAKKMMEAIYEIDKSMKERLVQNEQANQNFRDYIEMWIHEVKMPLANLTLLLHNHSRKENELTEQLRKLEDLVDQVLYYVRSEIAEKDYFIRSVSLKKVVYEVIQRNKDSFILRHINLELSELDGVVFTDEKWLIFILNQLIQNSLKYQSLKEGKVRISSEVKSDQIILKIWDNGIGILTQDLPRVFEKSFTGSNGRTVSTSTGMGLFIVKKLVDQLGHQIQIFSKVNEFTEVQIIFAKSDFYEVL